MAEKELKDYIVEQLEELKVEDIIIIDTSKTSSIADWVIIGSGRSGKHIESSMEILKANVKKDERYDGGMISGVANDGWIIYDLGNIIVHLFVPAVRDIYKLEELLSPKSKANTKTAEPKKVAAKKPVEKKTVAKKSIAKPKAKAVAKKPTAKKTKKED